MISPPPPFDKLRDLAGSSKGMPMAEMTYKKNNLRLIK
jgi:hypothetical protein